MTIVNGWEGESRGLALDWQTPSSRQNSLVTDLCVLYVRLLDGWLPAAAYVRMLGDLGVHEATARTGLHRMTKGGFLVREARCGVAGYGMSLDWLEFMGNIDVWYSENLWGAPPTLSQGWTLVSFSIPETRRSDRHALRSVLARTGFGTVSPGLWVIPGQRADQVLRLVQQLGYGQHVTVFTGDQRGVADARSFAAACWDLDAIRAAYETMLEIHAPRLRRVRRAVRDDPRRAFVDLTLAHSDWRLRLANDPGLPVEVVPGNWPGFRVHRLLRELMERLHRTALEYVQGLAHGQDRPALRP